MTCTEHATSQLRSRGFRLTPQRMLILHILTNNGGHLTPLQVYEQASQSMPGITEPTVYRTLDFLAENNLLLAAHIGSGKIVYEANIHDHHHVICRICGHAVEVDHGVLQAVYAELEKSTGFKLTTSHSTFFGLCSTCQKGA